MSWALELLTLLCECRVNGEVKAGAEGGSEWGDERLAPRAQHCDGAHDILFCLVVWEIKKVVEYQTAGRTDVPADRSVERQFFLCLFVLPRFLVI